MNELRQSEQLIFVVKKQAAEFQKTKVALCSLDRQAKDSAVGNSSSHGWAPPFGASGVRCYGEGNGTPDDRCAKVLRSGLQSTQ